MAKIEVDLMPIKRFENLDNVRFKLTKINSKRSSYVDEGSSEIGHFSLVTIPESDQGPEGQAAKIVGNGFSYLRTSPIVNIMDQTEDSIIFETEGGFYKLEKYNGM